MFVGAISIAIAVSGIDVNVIFMYLVKLNYQNMLQVFLAKYSSYISATPNL
jgi:hypothetical protein